MAKQLLHEGFVIIPVIHAVDLEAGTLERRDVGQQMIPKAELAEWLENQWPGLWTEMQDTFNDAVALVEADKAAKTRAERRRQVRAEAKTPAKKAAAKALALVDQNGKS